MARFLITGARAPVALELLRNLSRNGHQVYIADCLDYPLAKNSRYIEKYRRITGPENCLKMFEKDLIYYLKKEKIDYLLPTCEEIFYISFLKSKLSKYCQVLCDDFSLLSKLHSKYSIMELALNCSIKLPATKKINLSYLKSYIDQLHDGVIKKEFGRFGLDVLLSPENNKIKKFIKSRSGDFVFQEKIVGKEYSTYSIAHKGVLMAHSCYQSIYKFKNSSGFYFKPAEHKKIKQFVLLFIEKYNYSGQIGFDILDNGDDIYLIECNPRATSGAHLLVRENLAACLLGEKKQAYPLTQQPVMISLAMNLIALPRAIITLKLGQWWRDYSLAKDVIVVKNDKPFFLYTLKSLAELLKKSIISRIALRVVATQGIAWNGEPL